MIHFSHKKATPFKAIRMDSTYLRSFSEALLNWERNRQETEFAFSRFEREAVKGRKARNF